MKPGTGFIYLARPIDATTLPQANTLAIRAVQIADWLAGQGWGSYDPAAAFRIGDRQSLGPELTQINNAALGRCRGLVALLPPGVPSIGVPIEIERAAHLGLPVLVVGGQDSWALAGYANWPTIRVARPGVDIEWELRWLTEQAAGSGREKRLEPLLVRRLRDGEPAELPTRAHPGDAGWDLYASRDTEVLPGEVSDVPTNLAIQLPDWEFGWVVGRSSTLRTKGLQVHPGVIDQGYRGELFAACSPLGAASVKVARGERIAQLIVLGNGSDRVRPVWAEDLSESSRGAAGFGSSGQ
jgi:dUTP pyrophosphatase